MWRPIDLPFLHQVNPAYAVRVCWALLVLGCMPILLAPQAVYSESASRDEGGYAVPTHWAFVPPADRAVPSVGIAQRIRNAIDRFIVARLEGAGLTLSEPASRKTLLRRVTLDLIGLPPTPAELEAFLQDTSPHAYEHVVERLLADPRYGQRWARHWLDVVRYADSDGFEYDDPRPHAWRYRDWVIQSFNEDKSYDRFIQEKIAGDEIFAGDMQVLAATGLHRLGPLRLNAGNQAEEKNRQEVLTEMTDAIGAAFLGVTVGCARCHDHKFDAFLQADYFGLQAFFAGTFPLDVPLVSPTDQAAYERRVSDQNERTAAIKHRLTALQQTCRERLLRETGDVPVLLRTALQLLPQDRDANQRELVAKAIDAAQLTDDAIEASFSPEDRQRHSELLDELAREEADKPAALPSVMAVRDNNRTAPPTYILKRGEPGDYLDEVTPGFPVSIPVSDHLSPRLPPANAKQPDTQPVAAPHWQTGLPPAVIH